jgi:hypothetical protein
MLLQVASYKSRIKTSSFFGTNTSDLPIDLGSGGSLTFISTSEVSDLPIDLGSGGSSTFISTSEVSDLPVSGTNGGAVTFLGTETSELPVGITSIT